MHFCTPPRLARVGGNHTGATCPFRENSTISSPPGGASTPPVPPSPLVGPDGKILVYGWSSSRDSPRGKLKDGTPTDRPMRKVEVRQRWEACLRREA